MNTIKDRQADRHTHTNTKLQSFSLPSQYLANGLCLKEFSSSIHTLTWNKCKHQSFGFIHSSKVAITGRDHFCLLKLQLGIKTLHAEFWSQFFMSPNWQALFFFSLFVFFFYSLPYTWQTIIKIRINLLFKSTLNTGWLK